jgi:hypothetical protein
MSYSSEQLMRLLVGEIFNFSDLREREPFPEAPVYEKTLFRTDPTGTNIKNEAYFNGAGWLRMVTKSAKKRTKSMPKVEVYDIQKEVEKGAKKTHQWVKKHPWESVGIAAVVGAVLGKLLFGRK